jgi:hypothetical protein
MPLRRRHDEEIGYMTNIHADRFRPKSGQMRAHLFQNPHIRLAPTLFYDITIPLEPFDSGLEWEEQPVHTEFRLEFMKLPMKDWRDLDGKSFEVAQDDADGSIYLGSAHNPVNVRRIQFTRLGETTLRINCSLLCDFESERIADSVMLELTTEVEFKGLMVERDIIEGDPAGSDGIRTSIGNLVSLDAYRIEPQVSEHYVRLLPSTAGSGAA